MDNFVFQNATKIIFGKNTQGQVGAETRKIADKVLLVHSNGTHLQNSGLLATVRKSLQEAGVGVSELTGIQPNPILGPVHEGIRICRRERIGGILALGGGSPIDTAKAIAAGVPYEGDVWELFTSRAPFDRALPMGVLLTLPAAGSESSNGSVVTNEKTAYKWYISGECLRPRFAILNPELTFTLPAHHTFCGVADMMSHIMERYFSPTEHTDFTDRLCEATLTSIIRNARILLREPTDYHARAEIMWAGTIAHNDLLGTGRVGDWATHMIGMEISAIYDSTHGATLATITPSWARYVLSHNPRRFTQFATRVWNVEYDYDDPLRTAQEGIRRLEAFFREIGLPVTLRELKVPDTSRLEEMATKCLAHGNIGGLASLGREDVLKIYKLAW